MFLFFLPIWNITSRASRTMECLVCAVFIHKHHREGMGLDSGARGAASKGDHILTRIKGGFFNHDTHPCLLSNQTKMFSKKSKKIKIKSQPSRTESTGCVFLSALARESPLHEEVKWFLPPWRRPSCAALACKSMKAVNNQPGWAVGVSRDCLAELHTPDSRRLPRTDACG